MNYRTIRPAATEYGAYYQRYISLIPDGTDPLQQLRNQQTELKQMIGTLTDEQALLRYAPGKWSIKETLLHVIDTERIFAYRALRVGRGDKQPLPGFEQDEYVVTSGADARSLASLLAEYDAVRAATLGLFESFGPEAYEQKGTASNQPVTVRALAYITAGHEAHHLQLWRERSLPLLQQTAHS
ncbi:DinB family protein [Solirubrum puertoriconensis]|uniref:DNA damage-inducible protein DinB n=1 Tax=Solirubrum puertoriconensis TaxID=1751427 RepID=A0A9X0L5H2_SOLP1|nr:DinB family protein [Solirubrum puertoriconensis]KUG08580.1 DNA damage-inducible protein DinB [Solirubrum puertoriconensis]